jgi:hypothetical protein
MKRFFLFSLLLIFAVLVSVVFADEEDDFLNDLRRARERQHQEREAAERLDAFKRRDVNMILIYSYKDAIKALEQAQETNKQCLQYDDELMLQVSYGRYISAFEVCKKQGKGTQECVQRVQEAKERWRQRCNKNLDATLWLSYYKTRLKAEEIKVNLKKSLEAAPVYHSFGGGLSALAQREVYAFLNQQISNQFPGSVFDLKSGTGHLVVPGATLHYQGWIFIRGDFPTPSGLLVQVFDNRMNFVAGNYNIAVNLNPKQGWEIVEFNLPFDSQTEQVLNTLSGRGVRLTNKEIIDLVNAYLHDTVWEVDLILTFQKLLLEAKERRFFIESLLEYFAYDTYLKKVVAEETRQKQQLKGREQEQEQEPQQKQKTKKGRGTKK